MHYGIFLTSFSRKGRLVTMKTLLIAFAAISAATSASAAMRSYTPQGSAPYYWSDAAAWGGTLPGASDEAIANNSLLLANPLKTNLNCHFLFLLKAF